MPWQLSIVPDTQVRTHRHNTVQNAGHWIRTGHRTATSVLLAFLRDPNILKVSEMTNSSSFRFKAAVALEPFHHCHPMAPAWID